MAEYVIRLADERGHVQEQVQSAATADELRARFSQAGYFVYSVKPRGLTGTARKTKLETFLIFNQQFLTLIRAGLPILGSLEMLAKTQKNPNFSGQLQNVAARVRTGEAISSAFEAQGGFPLMYTTTLLAGERAGNLEEVLGRYLSFQRISLSFRKKLVASLIYPGVLITLVCGMFVFLITFVVPQFAKLYEQIGTTLPTITLMMLALGRGAQHYILYVLPVLVLLGICCGAGAAATLALNASTASGSSCPCLERFGSNIRWRCSPVRCRPSSAEASPWCRRSKQQRAPLRAKGSARPSLRRLQACAKAKRWPRASNRQKFFPSFRRR
jgi:type II secretory pathway component PulF